MNAVDTNVLLYVHDPRDLDKQATAAALLESLTDGVLLWQVACEYIAASRKLQPFGYSFTQAWEDINRLATSLDHPSTKLARFRAGRTALAGLQPIILGRYDHRSVLGGRSDAPVFRGFRCLPTCGWIGDCESI
jgi:hypothetical protein